MNESLFLYHFYCFFKKAFTFAAYLTNYLPNRLGNRFRIFMVCTFS